RTGNWCYVLFGVATVWWQRWADFAMVGKGLQCSLRHRVHGERCGQGLDVQNVRSLRILGPGAGPQQPLWTSAGIVGAHPSRRAQQSEIGLVAAPGARDTESIAD